MYPLKFAYWNQLKLTKTNQKWQKNVTILITKFVDTLKFAKIVKSVFIFELPNQFFDWFAQKVFALLNFDWLLIKYFKKSLEHSPKKKWTNITDYISIKSTKLAGLQSFAN